jgi:GNAT superfamily N-acetyltransferase
MLRELAVFEKLEHQLVGDEASLAEALFGRAGGPGALVAEATAAPHRELDAAAGQPLVAYAIFFENFSTFLCRRGLYLEDIYVRPDYRRLGIGRALFRELAGEAVRRGCGRMEWTVLDWNRQAIAVYQSIGGDVLPDWRLVRLDRDAISKLASS